jgi:hypothetical protein
MALLKLLSFCAGFRYEDDRATGGRLASSRPGCYQFVTTRVVAVTVEKSVDKEKPRISRASLPQGRQDSNLQPPVLETGALPVELRP